MKYAIVDIISRVIENIIAIDNGAKYEPRNGKEVIRILPRDEDSVGIGGKEVDGSWLPKPNRPQSDIDADIDAIARELSGGVSSIRALTAEVFNLALAADPALTPEQFHARMRALIAGF